MNVSVELGKILNYSFELAKGYHCEYVTPEVILFACCSDYLFRTAFDSCGGDVNVLEANLNHYIHDNLVTDIAYDEDDAEEDKGPTFSFSASEALVNAELHAVSCGKDVMDLSHLLYTIWKLEDSYAVYYMSLQDVDATAFMEEFISLSDHSISFGEEHQYAGGMYDGEDEDEYDPAMDDEDAARRKYILEYAPCLNDQLAQVNPLIGRESELERTIQILCRKEKNNPIHIGEPGVGKTAITYGLARMIEEGRVPEPLLGARIYSLDLGSLLAGTQYRGDLEKRLKRLLEAISQEENPIIYVDEIHNLAGAGAVGEGSFDVSNLLKPYLAQGSIRFIGATTYEEYKKYFEKNKSLARRFQNVDVAEPSEEETVAILHGLKKKYEKYHGVRYGKGVLEYAVSMSMKYINERFLPDKAIDLMDEAGAYRKIHPLNQKSQSVGKNVINEILTNICKVPVESVAQEENQTLETLEDRILSQVYGQDEAVAQVVNAIKYSRAGLIEDHKPLSSFLFAGPTGVGKTEIAKTLAKELGVKLIRFDMSEYGEKHSIAKLIGSPAGYVGYEEGGLLTEAIRKNPNCVLLLDEIEKAHYDIFHILLQVMDYATLTDNQGRKADFRNVIIIMTSNAGASQIGKSGIGFTKEDVTSSVIMEEVKRIFQPEFRNRLNRIVVFHGMDDHMASLIANKKLGDLALLLLDKKVTLSYSMESIELLSKKGATKEYGAREMDRIIQNEIKPLLVDLLLFGKLKNGGECLLSVSKEDPDQFTLSCKGQKGRRT